MRVYVAAPLPLIAEARSCAGFLESWGHEVASSWHRSDATISLERTMSDGAMGELGDRCLSEVFSACALVLLYGPRTERCGNVLEAGVAIGSGRRVFAIPVGHDAELPTRLLHCGSVTRLANSHLGGMALWKALNVPVAGTRRSLFGFDESKEADRGLRPERHSGQRRE